MKTLFLSLALLLSTSVISQIAPPKHHILLNLPRPSAPNVPIGPSMMVGGAAFIVAGLLTSPFMEGKTTTPKPFWKQGPRTAAVVSGSVVFVVGIGFTLGGK
jgi:hypothetical protein